MILGPEPMVEYNQDKRTRKIDLISNNILNKEIIGFLSAIYWMKLKYVNQWRICIADQ